MGTENQDIRWVQRFDNYSKALFQLENAVELSHERDLTALEKQGLIQAFEFTHELAWKMLKDFLKEKGNQEIYGSKDAVREAFKNDIIENGQVWMDMILSRNQSSHTYNQDTADEIVNAITSLYFGAFLKLKATFSRYKKELN